MAEHEGVFDRKTEIFPCLIALQMAIMAGVGPGQNHQPGTPSGSLLGARDPSTQPLAAALLGALAGS